MKISHLNKNFSSLRTGQDFLEEGKRLEKEGQTAAAIIMYKRMIRQNFQKEFGYHRMMILLRSLKDYNKELKLVEKAIQDFKKLYSRRNLTDKKAISASRRLLQLMGLKDDIYSYPQPLPRWANRRDSLIKIISGKK